MIVTCQKCRRSYDDAKCWTYCPHDQFISDRAAKQKDLAFQMSGKRLRFNRDPDGKIGTYDICSIGHDGMITLRTLSGQLLVGEFSPHLFQSVDG